MSMPRPADCKSDANVKPDDVHLIFRARSERLICFDGRGHKKWELAARGLGVSGDDTPGHYTGTYGDTPPGVYQCYDPYHFARGETITFPSGAVQQAWLAYGPWYVGLIGMEGQTDRRPGLAIHGGGSGLGTVAYDNENQGWVRTHGCIRLQNHDIHRVYQTVKWTLRKKHVAWLTVTWTA